MVRFSGIVVDESRGSHRCLGKRRDRIDGHVIVAEFVRNIQIIQQRFYCLYGKPGAFHIRQPVGIFSESPGNFFKFFGSGQQIVFHDPWANERRQQAMRQMKTAANCQCNRVIQAILRVGKSHARHATGVEHILARLLIVSVGIGFAEITGNHANRLEVQCVRKDRRPDAGERFDGVNQRVHPGPGGDLGR